MPKRTSAKLAENPQRIEPALLDDGIPSVVADAVAELSAAACGLGSALNAGSAASLADLVRIMNALESDMTKRHAASACPVRNIASRRLRAKSTGDVASGEAAADGDELEGVAAERLSGEPLPASFRITVRRRNTLFPSGKRIGSSSLNMIPHVPDRWLVQRNYTIIACLR